MVCKVVPTIFPWAFVLSLFVYTGVFISLRITELNSTFRIFITTGLVLISVWTYFKVILVGPGSPLDFKQLHVTNAVYVEAGLELPPAFLTEKSVTLQKDGRYRYCTTCAVWKPDRCHHCSTCNKCWLKRDHHCPWFAMCIGFNNQKFFIQALFYISLYSTWVFTISSLQLYRWFSLNEYKSNYLDFQLLVIWLLSLGAGIAMLAFTSFSVYQISINQTTNERYSWQRQNRDLEVYNSSLNLDFSPIKNPFDLGSWKANWCDVMGESCWEWMLPIRNQVCIKKRNSLKEKGLFFKTNLEVFDAFQNSMRLQEQLMKRVRPVVNFSTEDNTSILNDYDQ